MEAFTWSGATGTYNAGGAEQTVKTGVGSTANKWLYSKPCCGPLGVIPQAGNETIALRVAESHRLTNLVQFGTHLQGVMNSGPCTTGCGSQGADTTNVLFWADLDCSKTTACVVSQRALVERCHALRLEHPHRRIPDCPDSDESGQAVKIEGRKTTVMGSS